MNDVCLKCGIEISNGGTWGYCEPCGNEEFDKYIQDKLKEVTHELDEFFNQETHNEISK